MELPIIWGVWRHKHSRTTTSRIRICYAIALVLSWKAAEKRHQYKLERTAATSLLHTAIRLSADWWYGKYETAKIFCDFKTHPFARQNPLFCIVKGWVLHCETRSSAIWHVEELNRITIFYIFYRNTLYVYLFYFATFATNNIRKQKYSKWRRLSFYLHSC